MEHIDGFGEHGNVQIKCEICTDDCEKEHRRAELNTIKCSRVQQELHVRENTIAWSMTEAEVLMEEAHKASLIISAF